MLLSRLAWLLAGWRTAVNKSKSIYGFDASVRVRKVSWKC